MSEEQGSPLAVALSNFQAEVGAVGKNKTAKITSERTGKSFEYRYADLAEIADHAYPILQRCGLSFTASPTLNERDTFVLSYALLHNKGEKREGEFPLPDPRQVDIKQVGIAITYARRYCFGAVTGIVTEEDTDVQGAPSPQRQAAKKAPAKKAAAQKQVAGLDVAPETDAALRSAAQRRKYHAMRSELGWDEDAGHDFINDKSHGNATRWSDLDERGRAFILRQMQEYVDAQNEGSSFPDGVGDLTDRVPDA